MSRKITYYLRSARKKTNSLRDKMFNTILIETWKTKDREIISLQVHKNRKTNKNNLRASRWMDMKHSMVEVSVGIRSCACTQKLFTFLTSKEGYMLNHVCNSLLIIFFINWPHMDFHVCFKPKIKRLSGESPSWYPWIKLHLFNENCRKEVQWV